MASTSTHSANALSLEHILSEELLVVDSGWVRDNHSFGRLWLLADFPCSIGWSYTKAHEVGWGNWLERILGELEGKIRGIYNHILLYTYVNEILKNKEKLKIK